MLYFLITLIGYLQLPTSSLNDVYNLAYTDLVTNVNKEDRYYTRYLSIHNFQNKKSIIDAAIFTLNSTSFRSIIYHPVVVNDQNNVPTLIRINLTAIGYDKNFRSKKLNRYKEQQIDVSNFKIDVWEELIKEDFYFNTSYTNSNGTYLRGWIDPTLDLNFRTASYSGKPVLRADQFIKLSLLEPYYSQILMLPSKESDLYKAFGINEAFINSDSQLKAGGATLDSIVALHNRELQLIPSLYGEKFIWRTFDFNKDTTGDKSILENFAGTVKHDGREIIGSLPNGGQWYYLSNGQGNQVNVVPQDIAIDQRNDPKLKIKDRSVINAYKCISCHVNGINPFNDIVSSSLLKPNIGLGIIGKSYDNVLKTTIEDYYLSSIPNIITKQIQSYTKFIADCNGNDPETNATNINETIESYIYDLITPEQAIREMSITPLESKVLWRNSGNPYLVLLSGNVSIRRASFEQAFQYGMLVKRYPWDKNK